MFGKTTTSSRGTRRSFGTGVTSFGSRIQVFLCSNYENRSGIPSGPAGGGSLRKAHKPRLGARCLNLWSPVLTPPPPENRPTTSERLGALRGRSPSRGARGAARRAAPRCVLFSVCSWLQEEISRDSGRDAGSNTTASLARSSGDRGCAHAYGLRQQRDG